MHTELKSYIGGKGLADFLITCRSAYTHSELKFSSRYFGYSFSSTRRDDVNGARFKRILYSNPSLWETVSIPMTNDEEDLAFCVACRLCGMSPADVVRQMEDGTVIIYGPERVRYDLIGLLTFADDEPVRFNRSVLLKAIRPFLYGWARLIRPHPMRMWCSEAVAVVLRASIGIPLEPEKQSPSTLHDAVKKWLCSI